LLRGGGGKKEDAEHVGGRKIQNFRVDAVCQRGHSGIFFDVIRKYALQTLEEKGKKPYGRAIWTGGGDSNLC